MFWKLKVRSGISQFFVKDDEEIYDQSHIVKDFSQYYVGPSLAANIPKIDNAVSHPVMGCTNTFFHAGNVEKEIAL